MEIDPASSAADLLLVTGAATLDPGAQVRVLPLPGTFDMSRTYTILQAGSLSGAFGGVLPDFAFLDVSLANVGNDVELSVAPNAATFESVAETRNQRAVGALFDALSPGASGDLATVIGAFQSLSVEEIQAAYDAIGGEALGVFPTPQLVNADAFSRLVARRLEIVGGRALGSPGLAELRFAGGLPDARSAAFARAAGIDAQAMSEAPLLAEQTSSLAAVSSPPPRRPPIGVWLELREDARGLYARGRLMPEVMRAREVLSLMRAGALDGLSIGFRTMKGRTDPKTGVRRLDQIDLWEISVVTFPMLPEARVATVKRRGADDARLASKLRRGARLLRAG